MLIILFKTTEFRHISSLIAYVNTNNFGSKYVEILDKTYNTQEGKEGRKSLSSRNAFQLKGRGECGQQDSQQGQWTWKSVSGARS